MSAGQQRAGREAGGPAVTFRDLTLGYGGHPAVHHLSGAIRRGSLTAVVGANGSGKSTLMKGLAGLIAPLGGAVERADKLLVAYLPQVAEIDRSFPASVVDLVRLGLWPRRGPFGRHTEADRRAVAEALAAVGLAGFERRGLDTLSGGQMQRTLFARAILQDADLVVLDEPFNAVDGKTVADLIALILRWREEGRTVVAVLHDLGLVRAHFPETLLLARRPVAWGPTDAVLEPENLAAARRFGESWDEDAPYCPGSRHERDHQHGAPPNNHERQAA